MNTKPLQRSSERSARRLRTLVSRYIAEGNSLRGLARRSGVSVAVLSRWMHRTRELTVVEFRKVSEVVDPFSDPAIAAIEIIYRMAKRGFQKDKIVQVVQCMGQYTQKHSETLSGASKSNMVKTAHIRAEIESKTALS